MEERKREKIPYYILFFEFFKIGLFTFGGGMAMLPVIEDVVCHKKKWMSQEELLVCVSLSQAVPGVIAVSSSSYVGRRMRGMPGAVVSAIAVTLPSLIIISVLAIFLKNLGDNPYVAGAFRAIKAAVCGLIITSCIRLGKGTMKNVFAWVLAVLTVVAVVFLKISAVFTVIVGAIAGIIYVAVTKSKQHRSKEFPGKGGDSK